MSTLTSLPSDGFGRQRLWYWRGWAIRYSYAQPADMAARQRPPLVLIHGFGASLEQWRSNLSAWANQQPVYALDLLGFGHSQKPATLLGTQVWQAQVADFCRSVVGQPVILIGHSLGALVALTVAAAQPAVVKRLVLLTLPLARQELIEGWIERLSRRMETLFATPILLRPLFKVVRQPWLIRTILSSIYAQPERVDAELVHSFVRPTLDRGAARTLCYLVKSRTQASFSDTVASLLPQVTVPILLLWGTADRVLPLAWTDKIIPLNPRLTYCQIEGGSHCLYDEEPQRLDQELSAGLAAVA